MKRLAAVSLAIVLNILTVYAQKASDKQGYELIGPVKAVRSITLYFDYSENRYSETPSKASEPTAFVFDSEGVLLFKAVGVAGLIAGSIYPDNVSKKYDHNGNEIEFLSNDTVGHSNYRLRHIYDSNGRRAETEQYDPYILKGRWIYKYERFDERGNWTARTVTPETPVNGESSKRLEFRNIEYY